MPPKKLSAKSEINVKKTDRDNITLVIVESPGKIKKIQEILGDSYIVSASVGHIIDLAAKSMSIDIDNNFTPTYETLSGKESVIRELKKFAKAVDRIADLIESVDQLESRLKIIETAQKDPQWFAFAFGDFSQEIDDDLGQIFN